MKVVVEDSPAAAARVAAAQIITAIESGRVANLGLATGSSPQLLYRELARAVEGGHADFTHLRGFALDEYVGIGTGHPQSYRSVLMRDVAEPLRIPRENVHVPVGEGPLELVDRAAADFDAAIRSLGGVDLQILGIGRNGHIAFNEPGSAERSVTRRVRLAPATIDANSRFFSSTSEVPAQAVTQGVSTIMRARSVVLIASGEDKAAAVREALTGTPSPGCPASFLQRHADATFYLDAAAASQLEGPVAWSRPDAAHTHR